MGSGCSNQNTIASSGSSKDTEEPNARSSDSHAIRHISLLPIGETTIVTNKPPQHAKHHVTMEEVEIVGGPSTAKVVAATAFSSGSDERQDVSVDVTGGDQEAIDAAGGGEDNDVGCPLTFTMEDAFQSTVLDRPLLDASTTARDASSTYRSASLAVFQPSPFQSQRRSMDGSGDGNAQSLVSGSVLQQQSTLHVQHHRGVVHDDVSEASHWSSTPPMEEDGEGDLRLPRFDGS